MRKILLYSFAGLLTSSTVIGLLNISRIESLSAAPTSQTPANRSHSPQRPIMGQVDRHFIERMIPHHEEAVEMAQLASSRAKHSEIKRLAASIIQDQTREINQMRTWYKAWYGTNVPAVSSGMGRMGNRSGMMGNHSDRMGMHQSGMSMEMDLQALKNAPDFDREFIRQMVPHHQMAVHMAQMLLNRTNRPDMRNLAQSIIKSQMAEITQMQQWNQAWYR
ncbi:hypothetical protein NIES2135_17950 [Leptolyngbya boryana NIES-2135]|jgi:uncharacterized protein (DUF305 family)|uniref:DUF305 domain-containing protein n=1 Tax=Leptolyngbya boryana NIES-2135 TaxID=1973484 RepID=A0A1Z4JDV7_LEPBY|nr:MULTISPECIES: DUF305 domain-containing protein [Leptolyngbya]ULP31884.1 DUF305 domain-containing protein [Leptolyngbya boryana IU 594]BAY54975.1 hypothetical protein NIES2135_17950 [Leptolyngbya boryana NIES-2135]